MKLFIDKFIYAYRGLKLGLKDKAIQLQLSIMMVAVILAFLLKFSFIEWCIVLLCCAMVVSFEFLNSIIERMMDFIHPSYHEKVKDIKDMSAGMVLLLCMIVFVIGILLYGNKFIELIRSF